jgi:hypothetical protein
MYRCIRDLLCLILADVSRRFLPAAGNPNCCELSVPTVLFENVVAQFDKLEVHAVYDPVRRPRYRPHDLVYQLRVHIDYFLELIPGNAQDNAITQGP